MADQVQIPIVRLKRAIEVLRVADEREHFLFPIRRLNRDYALGIFHSRSEFLTRLWQLRPRRISEVSFGLGQYDLERVFAAFMPGAAPAKMATPAAPHTPSPRAQTQRRRRMPARWPPSYPPAVAILATLPPAHPAVSG